jgi:methylated-DNA-[protein]-cysteine S-methyltransferase
VKRYTTTIDSPCGALIAISDGDALAQLEFPGREAPVPDAIHDDGPFRELRAQLAAYFAGTRRAFELALAPEGTAFQQDVWAALRAIPYGATTSYGELARSIGRPRAIRAVGAANGANPIAIVVPCHRVIGKDGTLTGYGGGLPRKQLLLGLEARVAGHQLALPLPPSPSAASVSAMSPALSASFATKT